MFMVLIRSKFIAAENAKTKKLKSNLMVIVNNSHFISFELLTDTHMKLISLTLIYMKITKLIGF